MVSFLEGALIFLALWGAIYLAWRTNKKLFESKGIQIYPFVLIWRKSARDSWFPRLSKGRGYRLFETVSVGLAVLAMILGIYLIVYTVLELTILRPTVAAVRLEPIIPGVTVSLSQVPYLLLALVLSVSLHELMHALSSTSQGVKVRRGGLIVIALFPGAFVEPDQEGFSSSSTLSKLKVISTGIALNLILAGISLGLLTTAVSAFSHGALIVGIVPGSPAQAAGLRGGEAIISINGTPISKPSQLSSFTAKDAPLNVTLTNGKALTSIILTPQNGKIGVYVTNFFTPPLTSSLIYFLDWLFIINFSLSAFNGAPLIITDGGKLLTEMLRPIGGENVAYAVQMLLLFTFILALGLSL